MKIKRYVEMEDAENNDGWTNKVDIYGYDNEVTVWGFGFVKSYPTTNLEETKEQMLSIVYKLMDEKFKVINQEVRD